MTVAVKLKIFGSFDSVNVSLSLWVELRFDKFKLSHTRVSHSFTENRFKMLDNKMNYNITIGMWHNDDDAKNVQAFSLLLSVK